MERVRRRWWTAAVTLGAAVLIFGALVTALFQLVILIAPGYRQDLADYVSRVAGQPVDIGGVGLGWSAFAPRLDLSDITLYGEDGQSPALSAERLRLGFGLWRLLHGDSTPQKIELSGVELFVRIDADGKFSLRGLDTSGMPARATQDWLRQLGQFRNVRLRNCNVQLDDVRLQQRLPGREQPRFHLVDAQIEFADGRGQASAELELPPNMGSSVQFDARMRGDVEQPQTWAGSWSASVDKLAGLPWLDALLGPDVKVGFGDTALQVDGSFDRNNIGPVQIKLDAGGIVGRRGEQLADLHDIRLLAKLVPEAAGWALDLDQLDLAGPSGAWPTTRGRVRLAHEPDGSEHLDAEAAYLRLADFTPWLQLLPRDKFGGDLARISGVSGAVRGLVLRWDRAAPAPAVGVDAPEPTPVRYSLRADIDALGLKSAPDLPGFDGVSGEFSASENGGRLSLRDTGFALHYPKVFAQTVAFEQIAGELNWTRTGEGWDVQMPHYEWRLDGMRGEGSFKLRVPHEPERSPSLNLDARFSAADVTRLKAYMPVFWPQTLRDWLGRSIGAGRAPTARLKIDGDLRDFPFVDKPGTFALDIDAADARLAFAPDWPAIEKLAANLEFRGNSLAIRGESGSVMGTRVEQVEALIPDLHEGLLGVHGEVQGDAARFYDFLRASPLAPRLAGLLDHTRGSGDAVVKVQLDIPLHHAHDVAVQGEVELRGTRLDLNALPEPVVGIQGRLGFDNHGVNAQGLSGSMYGTAVSAGIATEADGVPRLRADFDFAPDHDGSGASALVPAFLRQGMDGRSRWQALLPLAGVEAGRLRLSSDLVGTALHLPAPMQKRAEEAWPLSLDFSSDPYFPLRIAANMPERLAVDLAFVRDAGNALQLQRARLRAGVGAPPHAGEDGISIFGTVSELDPLRWVTEVTAASHHGSASAASTMPALPLNVDLNVGRLWLSGQMIEGVRLTQVPAVGGWITRLSGNGALGELAYRETEGGVLTGRFERAQISYRRTGEEIANKTEKLADADAAAAEVGADPIEPARLPRLDLQVDNLRVGEAELGRLELRTARIADGQRIDSLRTTGPGGLLEAHGQWRRSGGRSSADLQFSLESDAIAELLQGLGYAPTLSAKHSHVDARLAWPESAATAPRGIRWALAEGKIDLDVDKGMLRAVKPGAGRVLGLINFWALPRRLTLDFRDVVADGLGFDQIKGHFDVGQGLASTDDLDIKAPSLKMEVRGKVGLTARDYDQRVTVYPDVSAGVTLGALLLGGPAAGVLALIAQEVLDQPLDQVGQLSYRLTGSWDDPQVVHEGGLLPGSRTTHSATPVLAAKTGSGARVTPRGTAPLATPVVPAPGATPEPPPAAPTP